MASGSPLQGFQAPVPAAAGAPMAGIPGLPSASLPENVPSDTGGLVVLSRDEALVRTLKMLGSEHEIFPVSAESDFAAQLLQQSTGVAILDASAVASPIERLTERLRAQFPELVLIVAGSVDDQSALATIERYTREPSDHEQSQHE